MRPRICIETDRIAAFCRQNHIRHLALYGSVLREDFRPESDVDMLVEFSPGQRVGFFRMAALERELSQLIGRQWICGRRARSAATSATRSSIRPRPNMPKDDRVRLRHMFDAAREAIDFGRGKARADLDDDRLFVLGLLKCIEIVGEAAAHIGPDTKNRYPEIPWADIVGMRNRLVHAYFDIDPDRVWDTLEQDLPPLVATLEKILARSGSS